MTRRQFASLATCAFVRSGATADSATAATFPVRFARPLPFDDVLRFVEPGSDEFRGEKAALDLERRLQRIFEGKEAAPPALRALLSRRSEITAARFFALPDSRVRFEIALANSEGLEYRTGIWQLPDFETVSSDVAQARRPWFRDVTSHVFGGAPSFREQLLNGNLWWRARVDSALGIDVYGNQGIAVGDIDNDGIDEIYVCQPGGFPNRLYKLSPEGRAEDITERSGVGILDDTTCALFADFRNSGLQDLVVLRAAGPTLFINQGQGRFVEQKDAFRFATNPQGAFTGMAAADYDRDGRLDVYLCCYIYFQSEDQYQFPTPYHDARNGPPNFLFRNRPSDSGSLVFDDVTATTGLNRNNDRFSFAPAWCDFNGDGWPDLYVANDFGRNNLYVNRAGKFTDEAAVAGVEDIGPGMSASWFDYDLDGKPDLYVSNMWSAAGQRIVRDPAFSGAGAAPDVWHRHTKGNSLYRNAGDATFADRGAEEHVEMGRWAWSSGGFDFDLDGSPEIFVASGMTTNGGRTATDLNSFFWRQVVAKSPPTQTVVPAYENGWSAINQLIREDRSWSGHEPNVFYVRRDGRYRDASGVSGLDYADDTRTFAVTDFDGDGNLDLILRSRLGPQVRAMQNDCTEGRPGIALVLKGTKSNRDAIGACVEVNGRTQYLSAGSGFLSQHSKKLCFGLAEKATATVKITWPSGMKQVIADLAPGSTYTVTEGTAKVSAQPFRPRREYPQSALQPDNVPEPADTWLYEPVPLPQKHQGPGFVLLHAGPRPEISRKVPVSFVDLREQKDEVAACFAIFRRYLFEYRAGLDVPMLLLIDEEGRARKVYFRIPGEKVLTTDLETIGDSTRLALPFPGRYVDTPRRNYFKLGAAFYWAGYPQQALPYLVETARNRPDNWKAHLAIGRVLRELGRRSEALASYDRVLEIRPNYVAALVETGELHAALGNRNEARSRFEQAIAASPESADALNQLGVLAAEDNRTDEARTLFQRAIRAQRDHAGAVNNLAVLYAKLGQVKDAIAAFRYGISSNPGDETLHLNLARIYVTMGEREQARAVLTQLLERKPDSRVASKALAELDSR